MTASSSAPALIAALSEFRSSTQVYPYPVGSVNFSIDNWYHAKVDFIYDYYIAPKGEQTKEEFLKAHESFKPEKEKIEEAVRQWCDSTDFEKDWPQLSKENQQKIIIFSPATFFEIRHMIGASAVRDIMWIPLPPFVPDTMDIFLVHNERKYTEVIALVEKRKLEQTVEMLPSTPRSHKI